MYQLVGIQQIVCCSRGTWNNVENCKQKCSCTRWLKEKVLVSFIKNWQFIFKGIRKKTWQLCKNQRISEWVPLISVGYFWRRYLLHCKALSNIYVTDYSPLSTHYIQCAKMLAKSRLNANLLRISAVLLVEISSLHRVKHVTLNFYTDKEKRLSLNSND